MLGAPVLPFGIDTRTITLTQEVQPSLQDLVQHPRSRLFPLVELISEVVEIR